MKYQTLTKAKAILTHAILLSSIILGLTNPAGARSMKRYDTFEISSMELDPKSITLGSQASRITAGRVLVDHMKRTMTLTLDVSNHCPKGLYCAAYIRPPIKIETSNLVSSIAFCGGYILHAFDDQRPVDGLRYEITIYIPGENICTHEPVSADQPVEIVLNESGLLQLGQVEYQSTSTFQSLQVK